MVTKAIGLGELITVGTTLGEVFAVDFAEVRLPVATRELRFLNLPERESDPPLKVTLRDAIHPDNETEWSGQIVRTEGALDPNSLELFAIARIPDPFGLDRDGPVLRIGQPVSATIRGENLEDVIAIPRASVPFPEPSSFDRCRNEKVKHTKYQSALVRRQVRDRSRHNHTAR